MWYHLPCLRHLHFQEEMSKISNLKEVKPPPKWAKDQIPALGMVPGPPFKSMQEWDTSASSPEWTPVSPFFRRSSDQHVATLPNRTARAELVRRVGEDGRPAIPFHLRRAL